MVPITTTIRTERLLLRAPLTTDVPFIFSASRHPGFTDGMAWEPPEHISETEASLRRALAAWHAGERYTFTICTDDTMQPVGRITLSQTPAPNSWEVGFWTHPLQQKRGYMQEALAGLIRWAGVTVHPHRLLARHALWNAGSQKVLLRNGFRDTRQVPEGLFKNGSWVPEQEVALLLAPDTGA